MDLSKSRVLITGGTSGIGRGLTERFLKGGAKVLITGRNLNKLKEMKKEYPENLLIYQNDLGLSENRKELANHVQTVLPDLNIIVNNGGIQRRKEIAKDLFLDWKEKQNETEILFSAPIHLISLLLPLILKNNKDSVSFIVNVTSGGAFIPQPFAPIYSACKAALHSYTVNLRHSLAKTSTKVIELIPPAVSTGLAGPGINHGVPIDEYCDFIFPQIISGISDEIGYGPTDSDKFKQAQEIYKEMFNSFSQRFEIETFQE